jgi:N-sulfoglucosamine sulfohydrolase
MSLHLRRLLVALSLLCTGALHAAEGTASPARPNILWLVIEDSTFSYVGPYGDPLARTPNFDRMAASGITFDRAYAPCPVCAPTRSTIITGRYAAGLGTQHMRSARPLPEGVKFFPEYLREAGYFCTNNAKTDYNTSTTWATAWDESKGTAHWRHRKPGQPFFAVFNFAQSHESSLHDRKPLITDPAKVRVPAYLPDTAEVRADLAQYFDSVSRADAALGRVLKELEADGLADDTIVFLYSDNGGCVSRSKRSLYDNGTHIALVAHFPKKFASLAPAVAGKHLDEIVNFVDLPPTVLSLVGLPLPAQFQGRAFAGPARQAAPAITYLFRDRMDERYDFARAVTDGHYHYIRNYLPDQPWGQHQDYQWKQSSMREWEKLYREGKLNETQSAYFEKKPVEELYDDVADPDNVNNLANDPAHRATRDRLHAALNREIVRLNDAGFMPEPMMIALSGGKSPTTVSTDPTRYPLARIVDFLDSVQLAEAPPDDVLAEAMKAPQPMLRYWAAVAAQRSHELPGAFAKLLDDADPVVRLTAAETLLIRGQHSRAWTVLGEAMSDPSLIERRLFALNAVARIPTPMPEPIRAQVTAFAQLGKEVGGEDYLARASRPLVEAATR